MTTTTMMTTSPACQLLARRDVYDWLYAALLLGGGRLCVPRYGAAMDVYERRSWPAPCRR